MNLNELLLGQMDSMVWGLALSVRDSQLLSLQSCRTNALHWSRSLDGQTKILPLVLPWLGEGKQMTSLTECLVTIAHGHSFL